MAAVALGFASCSEDRDPVFHPAPEGSFKVYEPEMADLYITLEPGKVIELTCNGQPDYGFSAICDYSAEVSLTPDFAESYTIEPLNPAQSKIQLDQRMVATAITTLQGYTDEEQEPDYVNPGFIPVYFRAICSFAGIPESRMVSNVVTFNKIKSYFSIRKPGYIYLVGAPEGWAGPNPGSEAHYADWCLFEDADKIDSKIYKGTFDIAAGQALFRFYTKLDGWNGSSWGSQVNDSPVDYELVGGSFAGKLVAGKGSLNFPGWTGGKMNITVDMSDMTNVTITIKAE